MLDGELIVKAGDEIASFSHLQQRLNRKSPDPKLIAAYPGHIILYDALALDGRDLRPLPLTERKAELARWFEAAQPAGAELARRSPSATPAICGRCARKARRPARRISRG